MTATKQINVRLPLELHKALDDHRVRTGEPKSDAIRRGIELALGGGIASEPQPGTATDPFAEGHPANGSSRPPDAPPPKSPTTAEDSVDLVVWLSGRTGMPRALCVRAVNRGRVTVAGHVWKANCVSKADLDSIRLDGQPV